jgi:putative transposase
MGAASPRYFLFITQSLNIVVIVKTNIANNRRCHVVLFSSDLEIDAVTLIEYYGLRFQIEFEFRDAKQHFGLSDFRCVSQVAVQNTVALAFFLGNLSSYLLQSLREQFPEAGILDLKSYYRGRRYALETLKYLPDFADDIVCSDILDKVCRLGLIHAPP